ncbi:hypothetical protein [Thiobacillus sp.]|uniref:hypothetical protein n=1 Tax=Thiobacillus sp. TaxID=924 RepID=UPI0011D5B2AF|nr:hypothetical protein [Thiobacillus sp.]TXH74599.1 MAG: hypothetical protein E6Q82_09805 [Thiobacillus sp.]
MGFLRYVSAFVGLLFILMSSATIADDAFDAGLSTEKTDILDSASVHKPLETLPEVSKYDTIYGRYIPGKGYVLSARENVGLRIFQQKLIAELSRTRSGNNAPVSFSDLFITPATHDEVLSAALSLMKAETETQRRNMTSSTPRNQMLIHEEEMFTGIPTPSATTMALASIELMLDDLLNRANSGISSALFAMRSHVAASESDLNVIFKNRMDEAFDNLSAQEQKILTEAQVLAANAQATVEEVEKSGFEHASDLVCQTTAGFANYSLGLPIGRLLPPDLLCLKELDIRDVGPQHEQILTFRGVHLQPKDEYPLATVTVAGNVFKTVTGGGDSVLQLPLQGGINGAPNDFSSRGDRVAEAEFYWPKSERTRRWLFMLKPYLVRSLDATLMPTIKGPVRKVKTQTCYIKARGGSMGSREEYGTCTILPDDGWEVESCSESSPMTANGDAGIRNRLFSGGACQWELHAKSEAWWGAGAWYGFEGRAMLKQNRTMPGKTYEERAVLNQNDTSAVFTYPNDYIPPEYQILQGNWSWEIDYLDNTDRRHSLTNSQPSEPHIGVGSLLNGVLTFTVQP